jgi:hypothetical protein
MKQIIAEIRDIINALWIGSLIVFAVLTFICAPFHHYRKNPKLPYNDPTDGVPGILLAATFSFLLLGMIGGILAIPANLVAKIMGIH